MECPYASVVIPCLHMPERLLIQLKEQTFTDFEIIIAKEKGIVNAMNKALDKARGEILIRIDDDVFITKNWLKELLQPFDNPEVCGATGPTFIPPELRQNRDSISFIVEHHNSHILKWLFDYKILAPAKIYRSGSVSYGSNFQEYFDTTKEYEIDHLEGTNWAMRTHLIKAVGGFDYAFNGVCEFYDTDVVYKVKKLGYKIVYNPRAVLWHIVSKGESYDERFDGFGRIKNWLRFHIRHSKFDHKKLFWFGVMVMYFIKTKGERWLKHS